MGSVRKKITAFLALLMAFAMMLTMLPAMTAKADDEVTIRFSSVSDTTPEDASFYVYAMEDASGDDIFDEGDTGQLEYSFTVSRELLQSGVELMIAVKGWNAAEYLFEGFNINGTLVTTEEQLEAFGVSWGIQITTPDEWSLMDVLLASDLDEVTVQPVFSKIIAPQYELTVEATEGGTVSKEHINGDKWKITATPESAAYGFTGWQDGNKENPRVVELTENTTFKAVFGAAEIAISEASEYLPLATGDWWYQNIKKTTDLYETMPGGLSIGLTANTDLENATITFELTDINGNAIPITRNNRWASLKAGEEYKAAAMFDRKDGLFSLPENKVKVKATVTVGNVTLEQEGIVTLSNTLKKPEQLKGLQYMGPSDSKDKIVFTSAVAFPDETTGAKIYLGGIAGVYEKTENGYVLMNGPFTEGPGWGWYNETYALGGTSPENLFCFRYEVVNSWSSIESRGMYQYDTVEKTWKACENGFIQGNDGTYCSIDGYEWNMNAAKRHIGSATIGGTIFTTFMNGAEYPTFRWDPNAKEWKRYQMPDSAQINSAYNVSDDVAYVGTDRGLYQYTISTDTWVKVEVPGMTNVIIAGGTKDGKLFLGNQKITSSGMINAHVLFDTASGTATEYTNGSGYQDSDINWTLAGDYKGNIYAIVDIGYTSFIYKVNADQTWTLLTNPYLNKRTTELGDEGNTSFYGDNFTTILNPIDKLSIFVGGEGAHLAMDGTAAYITTDIEELKASALTQLDQAFEKMDSSWFTEEEWAVVQKAYEDGKKAIAEASNALEVNEALNGAVETMQTAPATYKPETKLHVVVAVEKFTIGQGYIVEPVEVEVPIGTTADKVLIDLIGKQFPEVEEPIRSQYTFGFYLAAIYQDEEGTVRIDDRIREYLASNGGTISETRSEENWLGEFDYTGTSGWMYSVNGNFPGVGSSYYTLEDGDVLRWQFTLIGYGADLGADNTAWGSTSLSNIGNKDELTYLIATTDRNALPSAAQAAYDDAMTTLTTWGTSQEEIDAAAKELVDVMQAYEHKANVENAIQDLPSANNLTIDDREAVEAARAAYDALSEEEKEKVDPALVNDLKLAVATIEKLEAEKEVEEKQNTIDQLQEQLAEVTAQLEAMKEQLAKTPGWHQNEDGSWYFCDNKGETVKGWVSDGGKWYFMNKETGIMQTGWVKD
ncbi:MAG: DUF4430 domain-containing protein, partial [Parasporobacterium sp.]|nr:DUF4430 domain-containing protein [Parasporobacterium sp.]